MTYLGNQNEGGKHFCCLDWHWEVLFCLSSLVGRWRLIRLPSSVWTLNPTLKYTFYPGFTTMPKYYCVLALSIALCKLCWALCVLRNLAKDAETHDCHHVSSHPAWPLITRAWWQPSCGALGRCLEQGTNLCSVPELVLPTGVAKGPSPHCPFMQLTRDPRWMCQACFCVSLHVAVSCLFPYCLWC